MYLVTRGYSIKVLEAGQIIQLITEAVKMIWVHAVHKNICIRLIKDNIDIRGM